MSLNQIKILILLLFLLSPSVGWGQEKAPVGDVLPSETAAPLPKGWVVLELFSSQACVFCPKADALMKDFAAQDQLIALSCPVDYFDVKSGSLSIPACSARQEEYEGALRTGPKYTPQMVFNGRFDAVGSKKADILKMLERAAAKPVVPLELTADTHPNGFSLTLPEIEKSDYKIWFILFDKPHDVTIADGGNKGQAVTYYNVVTDISLLAPWEGSAKALHFEIKPKAMSKGFALLVQNAATSEILLATEHFF